MAKRELAIKLLVEEKEVNRVFALLGEDVLPQEELNKKFFDREPLLLDVEKFGEESFPITMAFVAIIEDDNRTNGL